MWRLVLVIGWLVSLVLVPQAIASLRGAVKYVARIGEVHDPWGTPVFMGARGSFFPSRLIDAFLSQRNE